MRPDGADDGEKIGAGFDERAAILLRDAADRAAGDDRRFAPIPDELGIGPVFGRIRRARAPQSPSSTKSSPVMVAPIAPAL